MLANLRLGRAFGIDLFIHWSFWLLPIWFFLSHLSAGVSDAVAWVAFILAVFGCVLLHELGHALMAARFGIGTRDITLYPIGGVARLERMGTRPVEELWIALAGPAVNVVIALVLGVGLVTLSMSPVPLADATGDVRLWQWFPQALLVTNVALVLFNLVPAFPMDGGRVLRALLEMGLGRLNATRVAVLVGAILAGLFGLAGLFTGNIMWCLLAVMVFFLGQQELAGVWWQERQTVGPPDLEVLTQPVFRVDPSARPTQPNFSGFTWDRRHGIWVEWREGRPIGGVVVG